MELPKYYPLFPVNNSNLSFLTYHCRLVKLSDQHSIKIAVLLGALIFFEQKVEIIPKDVVKESMLKEPIENVLAVLVPEISEHKDLLKDIEKKAKDATEKIKEGL